MEVKLEKKPETAAREEKQRILALLLKNVAPMASDYKNIIKHTGGLLSSSMSYAYSKGLQDAIKLIVKDGVNEEPIQEKTEASTATSPSTEK